MKLLSKIIKWFKKIKKDKVKVVTNLSGTKFWLLNGELHREGGPAVMYLNGDEWWYKHGKIHRIGGPAIICGDDEQWWMDNKRCTTEEHDIAKLSKILKLLTKE